MAIDWNRAAFETSFGSPSQLRGSDRPEVAFSGRSNVGKSSLLNKLFGRKALARVSATPGKTVTVNFFTAGDIRFADLPGYGYAKRPGPERRRFSKLTEHYFNSGRDIRLVVQLIDLRHPPSKDDLTMLEFLAGTGRAFIVALTKSDKLGPTARAARLRESETELSFLPASVARIPVSSKTGEGIERLKAAVEKSL